MTSQALLMAKAPVAGQAKTRLGHEVGMATAAALASAALADTLDACTSVFGAGRCRLALAGDLAAAVGADHLHERLHGWTVFDQRGDGFADRLAHAHLDSAATPVVQVGMDTPQLTAELLADVDRGLTDHDAVLGPAEDGGWWVLALREPRHAEVLRRVEMSSPSTYDDTRAALLSRGLSVAVAPTLRDVDTAADAEHVASLAPGTRFAQAWRERS